MITLQDQMGRALCFKARPFRIISLVPSITEFLHDIGMGEDVVGITKFCIHPDEWFRSKTRVGGTKQVKMDVIDKLQPDLIIANKEENTKEEVEALAERYPTYISDINTIKEAIDFMGDMALLSGKKKEFTQLKAEINHAIENRPILGQKKVAYLIWKDPIFLAGKDNYIDAVINLAGWENMAPADRYPEVDIDWLNQHVELVLLSSEPFPFQENHQKELIEKGLKVPSLLVDGEVFSWYGSRMKEIGPYFKELQKDVENLFGTN